MEIAILGLGQSGKSTLFQIMTGVDSSEIYGEKFVRGIAKVPDERFDRLVDIFKPLKVTPATVPFLDVNADGGKELDSIRQVVGGADSILHIVDCFTTREVPLMVKRYRKLEEELIFSDLVIVERRLERLSKLPRNALGHEESIQLAIMPELKSHLESGKALRELSLTKDEAIALKNFSFWSLKPALVVLNIAEGMVDPSGDFQAEAGIANSALSICCQIELEISGLALDEQRPFLESLCIDTPAFQRIIKTAFSQLERMYYFTVGEDEVRAWVVRTGSTAPQAAAAIHKDFERGFIKAEVVGYDDFMNFGKSLAGAKSAGKMRLEGKEYIVQDGDIISFRFNV